MICMPLGLSHNRAISLNSKLCNALSQVVNRTGDATDVALCGTE